MTNILVIDSSPNSKASVSRDLTEQFVVDWRKKDPAIVVTHRDVGTNPPPHLDQETIEAYYTPPESRSDRQKERIELSDAIVDEAEAADIIVIGSPMHNFGITSGLKTWLDQLIRVGRTFAYTENGPEGALGGRRVFVLTARGGRYSDGAPAAAMDSQVPYLRTVLGFVGLTDVTFVHAEGLAGGTDGKDAALSRVSDTVEQSYAVAA